MYIRIRCEQKQVESSLHKGEVILKKEKMINKLIEL